MQKPTIERNRNKILLAIIGLPIAVVVPLLIVTFIIGKTMIWFWAGIGLAMIGISLYYAWQRQKAGSQ